LVIEGDHTANGLKGKFATEPPGEVITESRDVTHWGENRGTSPVVIVGVDLIKKS
jgi:hypothetical protein